jgi:uncharacterized protein YdhG (YjbR/CyaY superfamily)
MNDHLIAPESVDDYIAQFPPRVRALLKKLRRTIKAAAPDAEEKISYRMPAYSQSGVIVYFAGYEHHIGLYPLPDAMGTFKHDLARYPCGKGSIQFPLEEPLPLGLIARIVKYRVAANLQKAQLKKKKR